MLNVPTHNYDSVVSFHLIKLVTIIFPFMMIHLFFVVVRLFGALLQKMHFASLVLIFIKVAQMTFKGLVFVWIFSACLSWCRAFYDEIFLLPDLNFEKAYIFY